MSCSRGHILIIASISFLSACNATLNPQVKSPNERPQFHDKLAANDIAYGMPSPIGYGRFSLFAIRTTPIRVSNGDPAKLLMDEFKDALEARGYEVAAPTEAPAAPIFECRVRRFEFTNFTWLFPLVFTWGDIELDLALTDSDGNDLWTRSYSADSRTTLYSWREKVGRTGTLSP